MVCINFLCWYCDEVFYSKFKILKINMHWKMFEIKKIICVQPHYDIVHRTMYDAYGYHYAQQNEIWTYIL